MYCLAAHQAIKLYPGLDIYYNGLYVVYIRVCLPRFKCFKISTINNLFSAVSLHCFERCIALPVAEAKLQIVREPM